MDNPLVSIIVPIYNAAQYLDQCITSIIEQTYRHLEIILVDDGSTDESAEICKKYVTKDLRVKYLFQPNKGVALARKNGTKLAAGEYVGFVDADDYIEPDMYKQLVDCCEDFDLVISQWYREDLAGTRCAFDKIAQGAYTTQEDMRFVLEHLVNVSSAGGKVSLQSGFAGYMWGKLFRKGLSQLVFENINENLSIGEDCDFTYRYFLKCQSVLVTDICGYHYRIHQSSAVHGPDIDCKYLKNTCELYLSLSSAFRAHPDCQVLLPQLQYKISMMLAKAPTKMGFCLESQNRTMVFPFINMLQGKRIALYGAGILGVTYMRQIKKWDVCQVSMWVDNNWEYYRREGRDVCSDNDLLDREYDYVVLAVPEKAEAEEIIQILKGRGIDKEKILWKEPLVIE